jgi:flagellar motor switch protein FliN/FliY
MKSGEYSSTLHAEANQSVTAERLSFAELDAPVAANAPLITSLAPGISEVAKTANPLHQIKARLTVCVGEAEVTVGDLLGAREQQVLRLDRAVDAPVDLLLEGQLIARGILVAVDDHFGVRITELPAPLAT